MSDPTERILTRENFYEVGEWAGAFECWELTAPFPELRIGKPGDFVRARLGDRITKRDEGIAIERAAQVHRSDGGAYTDDDVQIALGARRPDCEHERLWAEHGVLEICIEDTLRAQLDAIVPAIVARAKVDALRSLIRYCFDEHDAGVVVGGIETVETYVYDTIASLTGDDADAEAAALMRKIAAESYDRKTGRSIREEGADDE